MKKNPEQKAADALAEAVSNITFNPFLFAQYVMHKEIAVQWRILEAFSALVQTWRMAKTQSGAQDLADQAEGTTEIAETITYVRDAQDLTDLDK